MNILIIEDEEATARHLRKMLEEIDPGAKVLDTLDSVEAAVKWFRTHAEPDLLVLDIHLSDGLSFGIFREVEVSCPVIFTTAYDQYAIQAFRVNSIDYLLKPVGREALSEALKKLKRVTPSSAPQPVDYNKLAVLLAGKGTGTLQRLLIRFGDSIRSVDIRDAAYFRTGDRTVYVHTASGAVYPVDFSLDELEAQLDPARWFRINRQFIVSFDAIDRMTAYSKSRIRVTLKPPCDIESVSSTERSAAFRDWLAGK